MKSREIYKFRESYTPYEKPCVSVGLQLAVLFDEKDKVKYLGGRWDADAKTWYMPADRLNKQHPSATMNGGMTIHEYLNSEKMIMGQYGVMNDEVCSLYATEETSHGRWADGVYELMKMESAGHPIVCAFQHWTGIDAVRCIGRDGKEQWLSPDDAREVWNALVETGYNAIKNEQNA